MAKHAQQNAGKTQTMPRVVTIDSSTVNDHYPVGMPMKEQEDSCHRHWCCPWYSLARLSGGGPCF